MAGDIEMWRWDVFGGVSKVVDEGDGWGLKGML